MEQNENLQQNTAPQRADRSKNTQRPDDQGHIQVDGFVKISDPETGETFLETRA